LGKKKGKKKRTGLVVFIFILIILGITGGVFGYKVWKNGGGIEGIIATTMGHNEFTAEKLDTFYCVMLGQSQNLTDTIMLIGYNPGTQKASMLSIPRDTFVGKNKYKAEPMDKINALCQYDYPEKTVNAIKEITGIDVENYILIDTKGLKKAVDLVGGVYFDVPVDMHYTDEGQNLYIRVNKGYQLLDGNKAEQVVRFRHNDDGSSYPAEYGAEDIGRTKTQRAFLTTLAKQTLVPGNIFKIGEYIDLFYDNVKTNLTIDQIKDYIPYVVAFNTETLETGILPGDSVTYNGYSFWAHDKEATADLVENLFGDLDSKGTKVKVEILNGTGDNTIEKDIEQKMKDNGFKVLSIDKTSETAVTSIINRADKSEKVTDTIKELIGVGVKTIGESNDNADITIVLGKDYIEKSEGE